MRKHAFETCGFYHIFNRGTDKRNIFLDQKDYARFLESMEAFNALSPIGSLYELSFGKTWDSRRNPESDQLVNIICYCLNPNHFHFILEQRVDGGISEFMKRLSGGYTCYFNTKNKRSGVLYQGKFKSVPVISNEQLLHLSVYVNLNHLAHKLQDDFTQSSWNEYLGNSSSSICKKEIILKQFSNPGEYKIFAEDTLKNILERKEQLYDLESLLLE